MSWKRMLASGIAIGVLSAGAAVSEAGDGGGPELATGSLKVAYNFNFSCAITNENEFPVTVGRIEVLDSNGNVRAGASNVLIGPEQTRQVFAGGQNDRYHCHAFDFVPQMNGGGFTAEYDLIEAVEKLRMIFDVQSGGLSIAETEGRLVDQTKTAP